MTSHAKHVVQLLSILLLAGTTAFGQSTLLYFNEPPRETLARNGNQLLIHQFFSDRDDFIWFLNDNGLNRYDSHDIESVLFDPDDLNSLSSAHASDMIQDESGTFWITTSDAGLNSYDPQTGKVVHYRHDPNNKASLTSDKLRYLQFDEKGTLWIASDWGMNQFDPRTGKTIQHLPKPGEPGELQGNPRSPIVVVPGHIYISTTVGFEDYNVATKQWHCIPAVDEHGQPVRNYNVGLNAPNSFCKDRKGLIWMGVPNQNGLRMYDPSTEKISLFNIRTTNGDAIPFPSEIIEDRSGRLWLLCKENIYRVSADRSTVERCTAVSVAGQERLTDLITIYEDHQGLIWLERHSDKNPLFYDARQEQYPNLEMPMLNNVKPMATDLIHDVDGVVWITTDLGLIRYSPDEKDMKFVLEMPEMNSLSLLSDNYLLAISERQGLFIYDKKKGNTIPVRLNHAGGDPINAAIFSVVDHDGDLWISTWGYGLYHIPKKSLSLQTGVVSSYDQWLTNPADANSLASNLLQKIAVDQKNNVWVCGASNGLCRVDKHTRQVQRFLLHQGDPDGIASNFTYAPLIDKKGDVWVTSGYNAPLQQLFVSTGKFKKYGPEDGFTDNYFAHGTLDEIGKLWFNQNHVVSCIDPITGEVTTFPQFVGTSVYATPIAARLGTGEIYLSCQNNLRQFTPALIERVPRNPSPVRLVSVSSFDAATKMMKPLPENRWRGQSLNLPYLENTLEIKFALLDYRNTTSREYAYALSTKNEEPEWVNIGINRTVDFAQLKPGKYTFHLKARNSDGVWSELSAPLNISISSPWWLSSAAYVVYVFLLIIGVWFLMKARLRQQARELALREAVVVKQQRDEIAHKNRQNEVLLKEVHHRVKNNLGIVSGLLALQSAKITDPKVLEAIQASQHRVQSMSIIHQKLYQGEQLGTVEVSDYFMQLAISIVHSFGMTDRITIHCPMPPLVLDIDTAISVGLITNELLTNSLKYAFIGRDTGTISISLTRTTDDWLLLEVSDDGIGKQENQEELGFGTQLINLLTSQLDGVLTYENRNGTVVRLRFRRGR